MKMHKNALLIATVLCLSAAQADHTVTPPSLIDSGISWVGSQAKRYFTQSAAQALADQAANLATNQLKKAIYGADMHVDLPTGERLDVFHNHAHMIRNFCQRILGVDLNSAPGARPVMNLVEDYVAQHVLMPNFDTFFRAAAKTHFSTLIQSYTDRAVAVPAAPTITFPDVIGSFAALEAARHQAYGQGAIVDPTLDEMGALYISRAKLAVADLMNASLSQVIDSAVAPALAGLMVEGELSTVKYLAMPMVVPTALANPVMSTLGTAIVVAVDNAFETRKTLTASHLASISGTLKGYAPQLSIPITLTSDDVKRVASGVSITQTDVEDSDDVSKDGYVKIDIEDKTPSIAAFLTAQLSRAKQAVSSAANNVVRVAQAGGSRVKGWFDAVFSSRAKKQSATSKRLMNQKTY